MKENINRKHMLPDMHTHSEYSHDSICKIEAMCQAHIEAGALIMAVTDHCDICSHNDYDIMTPLKKGAQNVAYLNEKYQGKCLLLAGVEISEGFWLPEIYEKAANLVDYDVVIGSVHCVRYKDLTKAYSQIDFGSMDKEHVYAYLDAYFDDMLEMLGTTDIDILAHLTCPLRYITGKYGVEIDLDCFKTKILKILHTIIDKDIALEINTSSYDVLGDFMPGRAIIKTYYDMGGRLLTLGSDAHVARNAAIHFDHAVEYIKTLGFEHICYYRKRKAFLCPL